MLLFPNAKINLGLHITGKRADGYHELETLMYPISLTDIVTLNKTDSSISKLKFTTTGLVIDGSPDNNLITKAYQLLDAALTLPPVHIHLHKSIPFGAGLGGGSADCSFTILGLNRLFELNLTDAQMEDFAAQLGSDTPFFIRNKPALATGRGELLKPFDLDLSNYNIVTVIPNVAVSTKTAYNLVTPQQPKIELSALLQQPITAWKDTLNNDFETSVFTQFPEIKRIKETLYKYGAIYASLSGSGSAVFGIFNKLPDLTTIFPKDYFIWMK